MDETDKAESTMTDDVKPACPTTAIVIRCLNEAKHLPRLFADLENQTMRPTQVIVVDSGSTDGSVELSDAFADIVINLPPSRFTFGHALNVGCAAASADILVFVSAHVYPTTTAWLENLIRPFSDPDVGLVYGSQTGDSRNHFSEIQLMRKWFPSESTKRQTTPFCNNANCAVRRTIWEQHPYDETLPGLEDIAWAMQLLERGGQISYEASAGIVHVHEERFKTIFNRFRREAIAYKTIFGSREMRLAAAVGLFAANTARDYMSALRSGDLVSNFTEIPRFRAAQFMGAYAGHKSQPTDQTELRRRMYYPSGLAVRGSRRTPASMWARILSRNTGSRSG